MTGMTTGKETETMSQEYDKMMRQFADKYRHVCVANNSIDAKLFEQYGVKRGLRDKNGKGVLSGITNISLIKATEETEDGHIIPCDGQLYYRGYNIYDLTAGFREDKRYGFEEIAFLLLFGELPNKQELQEFQQVLVKNRRLPTIPHPEMCNRRFVLEPLDQIAPYRVHPICSKTIHELLMALDQ